MHRDEMIVKIMDAIEIFSRLFVWIFLFSMGGLMWYFVLKFALKLIF